MNHENADSRPDGRPDRVRDCLALALDVDDLVAATRLARSLVGHFRVAKVGLELYTAAGPEAVGALADLGYDVFCDLKLHDIPTTVARAARVAGELGVSYLTAHAAGGAEMLRAGAEGLAAGASGPAGLLAVTVLTSEAQAAATRDRVAQRMELAAEAGAAGVVCAAPDLTATRHVRPELLRAVPGIRLPDDSLDDQRRVASPVQALAAGADLLVVGRPVTRAEDPVEAAERLHDSLRQQDPETAT
ncbi:MAG: orotidine-5'-phosphate decarboxylase [Acidimicrobiaceae bacterium]|nr:orotidine-5'-phosphate decarboxylase [Acidimicrobiaceae bacterium]MCY4176062.1 orotidine-5'-phosphate decarboxylase [Acidimicrobiaceae bacterium]MCY4279721.1 orotidine-5'-phosphate decarboxylase [Acidimicrobiaceae bacterium]